VASSDDSFSLRFNRRFQWWARKAASKLDTDARFGRFFVNVDEWPSGQNPKPALIAPLVSAAMVVTLAGGVAVIGVVTASESVVKAVLRGE
jgi:hypothetical protein